MKKYLILCALIGGISSVWAQKQAIKLSSEKIEALFLKQNLLLMAEQMNIDRADAAVLQAKLWDNPNFSAGDINVWQPGREKQFSLEISQLIQTANKRAKLTDREKSAKEIALAEFANLLTELKRDLRQTIQELLYLQSCQKALNHQEKSLTQLIEACRKQAESGNISKAELVRLQSSLLELMNEMNETAVACQEQQKILKSLLNTDSEVEIEIGDNVQPKSPETMQLSQLLETASEHRPNLRRGRMQVQYGEKSLAYEKSLKVPDITVSASYDRYGGVWKNFAGVGVSFDLPFSNRNQGNIKAAKAELLQSGYLLQQQEITAKNEITEAFNNYLQAYRHFMKINENSLSEELDSMLEIYSRKLLSRDVGLLEYIDFMNTYKNSRQILFSARKQVYSTFESLQYVVGTEIEP